ncbi:helix-turn-helix transcriptional regulator [Naasia aerilata]|uniref:HTH luxR-type domain-containing protein n=1 Tax=Naasia aerilata TaxID=1162966 RepID=A0ABN6XKU4_9MICO|nr:response regulator transcription factor [Naasia aerilata]BDZ45524.1 hypothetical protein GCM10025866_14330 [Naasia aerilata]
MHLRHAEALAARGSRGPALEHLDAAAAHATELGAGLVERRAQELRRRLGAHSGVRPTGDLGITEREQQVLALVAQGMSNADIARALFISPKTASVHVSSILRKLGASTRTEAAYLAQRSMAPPAT